MELDTPMYNNTKVSAVFVHLLTENTNSIWFHLNATYIRKSL